MPARARKVAAPQPAVAAGRYTSVDTRQAGARCGSRGATLDRGDVSAIQRARIVAAMGELVRERGSVGGTVAHVVARSGISRRTFYELFEDREACFLAAFDCAIAGSAESVIAAYRGEGRWRERIRAGLAATLAFFDAEPERGYLCVVGALGSGTRALERHADIVEVLVDAVHEGAGETRRERQPDRLVAEGVVGAVLAVIHKRMQERDARPLVGLLNPLMGMIVLPYLGPAAGERELTRPQPRAARPMRSHGDPLRDLDMRLTYRTVRVLLAIAANPRGSNREVSVAAGISDQGQISKLLARLQNLGLIHNAGRAVAKGEPNAWTLTAKGHEVAQAVDTRVSDRQAVEDRRPSTHRSPGTHSSR
jgi:AcrR family transcriptional regulator